MRILILSNFYPPHFIGGYELACHEMAEVLAARGHAVGVLTSTYGVSGRQQHDNVWRWLGTDLGWKIEAFPRYLFNLIRRELADQRAFRRVCKMFRPDVVYAWNLRHLTLSVCLNAQRLGIPVCYFVFDDWLCELEKDPWYSLIAHQPPRPYRRLCWRVVQSILGWAGVLSRAAAVDFSHVQFGSQHLKETALRAGRSVTDATVIRWGIELSRYRYKATRTPVGRLLYVGQIAPHKGVHTAVEALNVLIRQWGASTATLTIVGGSIFPGYAAQLRQLVGRLGLEGKVRFLGQIARDDLAHIYAEYDVLLFPSVWDEPFGITPLEGMAAGVPIVGTATGGAAEFLRDGVNALVFPKEDAAACARQIQRLLSDLDLYEGIRAGGRRTVEEGFRIERTLARIEKDLAAIAGRRSPRGGVPLPNEDCPVS